MRILVDIGCTGLSKAAFPKVSISSSFFLCSLCCLGAQEKDLRFLKSCVAELKISLSELESKLDIV